MGHWLDKKLLILSEPLLLPLIQVLCDVIQDDAEPAKKKFYELKLSLLDEIGWTHLATYERQWMLVRFPPSLPLFQGPPDGKYVGQQMLKILRAMSLLLSNLLVMTNHVTLFDLSCMTYLFSFCTHLGLAICHMVWELCHSGLLLILQCGCHINRSLIAFTLIR